ncbi:Cytotoxic translational repressor of toxin-antitoxin stability system [Candidatus Magnetomoraceae bacterium gMMP-15]
MTGKRIQNMQWNVRSTKKAKKQTAKLPANIKAALFILISEITHKGPVRGNWPNYSSLRNNRHHCHLKKGRPTYVAVWEVINKQIRLVEICYVGTHEKAPY